MIYVLLSRFKKTKKQEIWTIQTHERAIVLIKANGVVARNASART